MIDGQSLIDDTMTVEETELEKTASIDLRRLDFSLPLSPGSSQISILKKPKERSLIRNKDDPVVKKHVFKRKVSKDKEAPRGYVK